MAAEVPFSRSGDYRFTIGDGTLLAADAYQPSSPSLANIAANAIEKSDHAPVAVIQFGRGATKEFGQTQAEAIADHILTTPDHNIRQVIIVKDGCVILNKA